MTHEEELQDRKGVSDEPRPCRNCGRHWDSHSGPIRRCPNIAGIGYGACYEPVTAEDILDRESGI